MIDVKDPIQIEALLKVFAGLVGSVPDSRSSSRATHAESDKTQNRPGGEGENNESDKRQKSEEGGDNLGDSEEQLEESGAVEGSTGPRQTQGAYQRLTPDLEASLVELVKIEDPRGLRYFKIFFSAFVEQIAKSIAGAEYEELLSPGMLALVGSAKKFDYTRNVRLTQFARFSVTMAMLREYYQTRSVKVSVKIHRDIRKMSATASSLRLEREATDREIALRFGWKEEYVRELKHADIALRCVSLDARMKQDAEGKVVFDVKDKAPGPEEIAEAHERIRIFLEMLSRLPAKERRFFRYRCDISDKMPTSIIVEQMLLSSELVSLKKAGDQMKLSKIQAQRLNDKVKVFLEQNCPSELAYLLDGWKPKKKTDSAHPSRRP